MKVPNRPELEPGEWQQEPGPFGRRFRMIGNTKEYEPDINGIPAHIFHASNKATIETSREPKTEPQRICPFIGSNSINTACKRGNCALFVADNCALAQIVGRPAQDTTGRQCPFYKNQCRTDCALYKDGCALTSILLVKKGE